MRGLRTERRDQGTIATSETPSPFGELASLAATASGSPLCSLDVSVRDALGRIETRDETLDAGPATTSTYTSGPAGRLDTVAIAASACRRRFWERSP